MLPSKGYFSSIDCPFYANKLCHRYYCQFRHAKTNSTFSPTLDMIDNLCEDESISKEILKDIVIETKMTSSSSSTQNREFQQFDPKRKSEVKHDKESVKNKSYLLPVNIPKYNPTPISKLMTRQIDNVNDGDSCVHPYINNFQTKPEIKNDRNLDDALDYFDNDKKSKDTEKDQITKSDSKMSVNVVQSLTTSLQPPFGQSMGLDNQRNDNPELTDISLLVKENQKLKEMVLKLQSESDHNESTNENVIMNKRLLMDLIGLNEPVIKSNKTKLADQCIVNKEHTMSKKHKGNIKSDCSKHNNEKKYSSSKSKGHETHKKSHKQKRRHSEDKIKNYKQTKYSDNYTSKNAMNTQVLDDHLSSEVIVISDSEELDTIQDTNKNKKSRPQPAIDSLPQPKNKKRMSHIKESSSPVTKQRKPNCFDLQGETHKEVVNNQLPMIKQKSRIAHTLKHQTLSLQSVEEHVTHWQKVRERIQKKCENPSGQEGYQNWAKVKISPVSNVSSIINSKNSIFSKINQWKRK